VELPSLVQRYYAHAGAGDLADRSPQELAGTALAHLSLAARRFPDEALVRVTGPGEPGPLSPTGTAVQVVSADLPFVVDSITAELTRLGCGIASVLHPVLDVRRDASGRLLGLDGGLSESWVHVELEAPPLDADAVVERLDAVLADLRATVDDGPAMAACALELADALTVEQQPQGDVAAELLRWLTADPGTLLGSATWTVDADGAEVVPGSELGLLRRHGAGPDGPAGDPSRHAEDPRLLVVSSSPVRSTVHKPAHLDSVAVRRIRPDGTQVEHRFLCLLPAAAYADSVQRVPVVRHKVAEIVRRSGFSPRSHSGRDLLQILETYPREELFQAGVEDLSAVAHEVMHLRERRRLRLFLRRDHDASYLSCLVYLPRDRYGREVRQRMQLLLAEAFEAASVDHTVRVTESVLARVHFVVRPPRGQRLPDVDRDDLERRLAALTRSWDDDLADELRTLAGPQEAARLLLALPDLFPEAYKEDCTAQVAATDLRRIASLTPDVLSLHLSRDPSGMLHLRVASTQEMSLSAVLPVLRSMAVEVVEARDYRLHAVDAHLYDYALRTAGADRLSDAGVAEQFQAVFAAAWSGAVESDGLNALVLRAGLTGPQVVVLRAYAQYLRQGGWSFTPAYVEECLTAQSGIARRLVELFEVQLDPAAEGDREQRSAELAADLEAALADVPSLDQDRILRSFLHAVRATVRTNHWVRDADGRPRPWLSFKLAAQRIPGLPEPRPEREVWVYSPEVEGAHLRFGAVARGGLRWSDRREDFRTEVLGLVKAQVVKNAVIVPVGAKGAFVAKRLPDPAQGRDAWQAAGTAAYRTFVRGLLDVTDNRVGGTVVPPEGVVRRDSDDPYLVVAADKGTATFSDTANEIAAEYGFWLGDAFASGGSVGYDHKAMGITARGAWESVRRHFRELDVDPDVDPVTVVGIGDMSGDVFGNGLLLSRSLRLVAAFDHRHVFVDPDPDPDVSYAERQRLFALPRSSWDDYDRSLLSPGGGVHPRSAKSVPIPAEVGAALGLPDDCFRLTPNELLSAVLRAPVDLLWNGGIGTWVKASTESPADAGDKANDAVRVDGRELRCRVVGEGGNLGLTQRGRIEAAQCGVRLNTDAIDNSAGVACSDAEVNIKVLLEEVVSRGDLARSERDALLVEMTNGVADLVLRGNRAQNVLLGNARAQSWAMLPVHRRYLRALEDAGRLDRTLEALPSDTELEARGAAGTGLTSPEFAVLTAYAKNTVKADLLASALPDEPWYDAHLRAYFPQRLVERFGADLSAHPLRREIVTTSVVNELVDQGGTSFAFRAVEETGARTDEVVRAYTVATEVFGLRRHWRDVEALRAPLPVQVQVSLHLEARRLVDRVVRRQLADGARVQDVAADVERYRPTVAALLPAVPELVSGAEHDVLHGGVARREAQGVPAALARHSVSLLHGFLLLDVVDLADAAGEPPEDVAPLHYLLSAAFDVDAHLGHITHLPRVDRWQALARSSLRDDLYAALARLTANVLRSTPSGPPQDRIAQWEAAHADRVGAARARLRAVSAGDAVDLAALSVVVRTLRTLLDARSGTP